MICGSIMLSCNKKHETSQIQANEEKINQSFDWLVGDWKRVNEQEDRQTFETWVKKNDTVYSGESFTLKNLDTISQEKIMLTRLANSNWKIEVSSLNDSIPTSFKVTTIDTNHFVCENSTIEFPKKIEYWKEGNTIKAKISNETMEIPFEFEKVNSTIE